MKKILLISNYYSSYISAGTSQRTRDIKKGLSKLGIEIPAMNEMNPYGYGAYVSSIELLKDVAPFTCFLEHDVPRQRLFQAALAAYGAE